MTANAKKAIKIGSLCFLAYLAVYIAKNILGTVTPAIEASGFAESEALTAKSVYFYAYAIGQLINGAIGDKIKAKYTIVLGDNEIEAGEAELKNMKTGEKKKISIGEDFIDSYLTESTAQEDLKF